MNIRIHFRDTHHDLRIHLCSSDRGAQSCNAIIQLHQFAGLIVHVSDLWIGGFPDQGRIGGILRQNRDTKLLNPGLPVFTEQQNGFFGRDFFRRNDHLYRYLCCDFTVCSAGNCNDGFTLPVRCDHTTFADGSHLFITAFIKQIRLRGISRRQDRHKHLLRAYIHPEVFTQADRFQRLGFHNMNGQLPPQI